MKASTLVRIGAFVLISSLVAGCASTPALTNAAPATTFQHPIAQVQKAAVLALVEDGFNIAKQEPTYVQGKRPHEVGFFVGSGGETVGVWLTARGANTTEVRIDTAKSFAGHLGQKDWDSNILTKMRQTLAE